MQIQALNIEKNITFAEHAIGEKKGGGGDTGQSCLQIVLIPKDE